MNQTRMSFRSLALLLALLALPAIVSAQQGGATLSPSQPTGKVAEIETYAKGLDQYIKSNEKTARIFADTASGTTGEAAKWREFQTKKEREDADTGENLNENAYVWMRNGKIIGANFTFQSPSRDWVHYVMYYFRNDGTLAKTSSTLNTFMGDITVIRDDYYDSKGTLLKGTTHCKDLKTQRSKPCGNFQEQPTPFYKTVNQLPFYSLLKK
jgi:hypothetical protein